MGGGQEGRRGGGQEGRRGGGQEGRRGGGQQGMGPFRDAAIAGLIQMDWH
jgi:hypothetical protein